MSGVVDETKMVVQKESSLVSQGFKLASVSSSKDTKRVIIRMLFKQGLRT